MSDEIPIRKIIQCAPQYLQACPAVTHIQGCLTDCFCSEYSLNLTPEDCTEHETFIQYNIEFSSGETTTCYDCVECLCEYFNKPGARENNYREICLPNEVPIRLVGMTCADCASSIPCYQCQQKSCVGSLNPCCGSIDEAACCAKYPNDPCCGDNTSDECNPCQNITDQCCAGSSDPCCGSDDPDCCDNYVDPCCGNHDSSECYPCDPQWNTDPCCGDETGCCGSANPDCDPCLQDPTGDGCTKTFCEEHPEDPSCSDQDPCLGVSCPNCSSCDNGVCSTPDQCCVDPTYPGCAGCDDAIDPCCNHPTGCGCPDECSRCCERDQFCQENPEVCDANNGEAPNNIY